MYNPFKSTFLMLLAVLLAFTTISFHASAKQHYNRAYHSPKVTPSVVYKVSFDLAGNPVLNCHFDVPPRINIPGPAITDYLYLKDDAKPNNLNYQLIKRRQIGLINSQRNN